MKDEVALAKKVRIVNDVTVRTLNGYLFINSALRVEKLVADASQGGNAKRYVFIKIES